MKLLIFFIAIISLIPLSHSPAFAWHLEKTVTPYGDVCPQCGNYGTCKSVMTDYDAENALNDYYKKKGLKVEIEKISGRFIKAGIYNKEGIVDIIIFDRKTGRIRSIY